MQARRDPTLLILAATALTTIAGATLGAVVALVTGDGALIHRLLGGLASGAAAAVVPAFAMAWHGSAISQSPGRSENAAFWGVIPAALVGLALAPPLGAIVGYAFGYGAAGGMWGFLIGPLVAVAAWQICYLGLAIRN